MDSKQNIIAVWKPKGLTMGQLTQIFKADRNLEDVSATFAGRLDPLAEGVVVFLIGEAISQKEEIIKLEKEYEFEFVLGFNTDTYDILGLVENESLHKSNVNKEELEEVLRGIKNIKTQSYPPFSSKTVSGKPLHEWVREGRLSEIEIPERSIAVESIEILEEREISANDFLNTIMSDIQRVEGDFRQEEIIKRWKEVFSLSDREIYKIFKMRASVSSGTYIRGIVEEIGKVLGSRAVTLSIKRIKVGDWDMASCRLSGEIGRE